MEQLVHLKMKIPIIRHSKNLKRPHKHSASNSTRRTHHQMFNYKSVTSSEPQIRSRPALRQISANSGFHKRLSTLLEPTPLPFSTFQILKETSQPTIQQQTMFAWVRPAHLRSQLCILSAEFPLLCMDPKHSDRLFSLRIPFDKQAVQRIGPIVCEAAWDAQEHVLWIWDVLVWEKQVIWNTKSYKERWELVKQVVSTILDCGHPMSDAEVRVPTWQSLSELATQTQFDPAQSIEFQPDRAGQRRQLFLVRDEGVQFKPQTHAERKMVAEGGPKFHNPNTAKRSNLPAEPIKAALPIRTAEVPIPIPAPTVVQPNPVQKTSPQTQNHTVARIRKDEYSKLPDTYQLYSIPNDEGLGLAAIRSLTISTQLRTIFQTNDTCLVDIQWYEPFHKYEIKRVHTPS